MVPLLHKVKFFPQVSFHDYYLTCLNWPEFAGFVRHSNFNTLCITMKSMKKIIFTISILANLVLITAADFKSKPEVAAAPAKQKSVCGYRIVEFGKGVDCNGDTIKLAKVNGVQVRIDS